MGWRSGPTARLPKRDYLRSKSPISTEGRYKNVIRHHPAHPTGLDLGRCAPDMAVQQQLGLLSERWTGFGAHRASGLGVHRAALVRSNMRTSIFSGLSALVFASCLVVAADEASARRADQHAIQAAGAIQAAAGPSKFDFLVLASLADSPHLLAMAGYRSTSRQCAALSARGAVNKALDKKASACRS